MGKTIRKITEPRPLREQVDTDHLARMLVARGICSPLILDSGRTWVPSTERSAQ